MPTSFAIRDLEIGRIPRKRTGTHRFAFPQTATYSASRKSWIFSHLTGFLLCLGFTFAALSSAAATVDTSFDAQCPILFSQADSFGKACLANAQPFTTYFDGEPEYHSAYIGFASPGSHFGLGCALNAHHQIAYLGIYYTLNTDDFAQANSATITTVDFDGNIGVRLDGRLVNFIAIRPFETSTIPLPYYAQGAKNCESPVLSP
jgi:hypothetical protein